MTGEAAGRVQVAVLDDWQAVAPALGPWDRLGDRVDVHAFADHVADEDELVERLEKFEVVVAMRERTPLRRRVLERLPALRLLITTGMANAAIDVAAARERGVVVSGTRGGVAPTVELAWALILAVTRNVVAEDARVRAGGWQHTIGPQLAGRTLGIVGLGRIGARMAEIARAFEMDVLAWSEHLTAERASGAGARYVERDELLRSADVVTIHLRLSDRTRGLIGARELALMRPSAYLVNTSRGPIVDEDALLEALRRGTIAGAGLDVFAEEPLPADHPLRTAPRTVLTPHLGYVSEDNYRQYFADVVEDVAAWLDGAPTRELEA